MHMLWVPGDAYDPCVAGSLAPPNLQQGAKPKPHAPFKFRNARDINAPPPGAGLLGSSSAGQPSFGVSFREAALYDVSTHVHKS